MAISNEISHASVDELLLDPKNPRLGRRASGRLLGQDQILEVMRTWDLDELAVSFLQSKFWPQEALLVIADPEVDDARQVVAEGNRRLAALKLLKRAYEGHPISQKWREMAAEPPPEGLFERVPVLHADSRDDIEAYLGFRHVTGIKEWAPAEKAAYIARLVDGGMNYVDVMRAIGSKTPTVRQNYIAYKIFMQLEGVEDININLVEQRFSLLFLALREQGVQTFLGVNIQSEPAEARVPISDDKLDDLRLFIVWVFGTDERDPLFTDSREMGKFGKVLLSEIAIDYLTHSRRPTLEAAMEKAGTDHEEVLARIQAATDEIELALSTVHLYADLEVIQKAVGRLLQGIQVMLRSFPSLEEGLASHAER